MVYDSVHDYLDEVAAPIIKKSGVSSDRYHFGKLILHSLREDPDFVMQIDGATGESETNGSVLNRSIRCAIALQKLGLQYGHVMVLMGPNHLDICVPKYAGFYLGIMVAGVDSTLGVTELEASFNISKPNIIFCQSEKAPIIEQALGNLELKSKIITFNEGGHYTTLCELLKQADEKTVKDFEAADFDTADTTLYLTSTSGTTGLPKAAMLTHKSMCLMSTSAWQIFPDFPRPTKMVLVMAPIQWLGAGMNFVMSSIIKVTRLQTSLPITPDHFDHLLNTYKPTYMLSSPVMANNLLVVSDKCDFTCIDYIILGGSTVSEDLVTKLRKLMKSNKVSALYGLSEISGVGFQDDFELKNKGYYCVAKNLEYRLVDTTTKSVVAEANVAGELWVKGPQVFKGYYKNPEMTREALTEDGWIKTGDIFYRNENGRLVFVERYKSLLKYKSHQISPAEIEAVIRKHPGVSDVYVVGIPDEECGDLIVACVIPKPENVPKAQEIKDLVKEFLTDSKQLRGGVIFIKELPITTNSKISRVEIQKMALTMKRE